MTTATLRFTLDLAISKATQPHNTLIFQPRSRRPHVPFLKIHDAEIPEPEIIEIWEPTELDLNEWPYDPAPERVKVPWIRVMNTYERAHV